MLEKLKNVEKRYEKLSAELFKPEVISDREKYAALMKEMKSLSPVV